jgi:hypothetical protein
MGVLVRASFSISRILYLLDTYYTTLELGCQGNSSLTTDYADFTDISHKDAKARREPRIHSASSGQVETKGIADPFDGFDKLTAGKLRTGFADYTDLGIRVYKYMRIYLYSAI